MESRISGEKQSGGRPSLRIKALIVTLAVVAVSSVALTTVLASNHRTTAHAALTKPAKVEAQAASTTTGDRVQSEEVFGNIVMDPASSSLQPTTTSDQASKAVLGTNPSNLTATS